MLFLLKITITPVLVALMSLAAWQPLMPRLEKSWKVIRCDLRGQFFLARPDSRGRGIQLALVLSLARRRLGRAQPAYDGEKHFGSRLVVAPDGMLYVTVGEISQQMRSQDLNDVHGSILRLTPEGKVPADIMTKVKAREADILAGKFMVKVDDSQPKSTAK